MSVKKLKYLLDSDNIKYVIISHSPAYTALQEPISSHISLNELVKTAMVKIEGRLTMVVLPAL